MGVGTTAVQCEFEHIQGKRNVVADVISRLRMCRSYQDNNNEEVQLSLEDVVENTIEEIHNINSVLTTTTYNIIDNTWPTLKTAVMRQLQQEENKTRPQLHLRWEQHLKKAVKLRYSIVPTILVPRKLMNIIILEFHNGKGHQEISHAVNMMQRYFWWIGIQRDIHQHINIHKLCTQFLPNKIYM